MIRAARMTRFLLSNFLRQPVQTLEGGTQRARRAAPMVVLPEGLLGSAGGAEADGGQLALVVGGRFIHHDGAPYQESTPSWLPPLPAARAPSSAPGAACPRPPGSAGPALRIGRAH